ncbi:RNA-directed DNA polymerase [Vagococcus luciliae]|uniref:Reverse transcriptase domain-containing protein n=1 Tax=Vagococcus luciliae TaxID=2920380 RepID=A0ABY5NYC4_9ENTE|nr:RNA-directed DNA polymerase [Vagococcus luciliae]UUV98659.1 hypothetical protein G314FT_08130 [Vagococcus luciliae]
MVRIPNLNKINNGKRVFFNPNDEQKKEYNKIKNELVKKYSINLSNRDFIIKQLIATLTHGDYINYKVPEINLVIIRSDIKNFYPSINKHELYKKLKKGNLLSQQTFNVLQPIFFSGSVTGIPLGLPFSSVLSEIYLERFDEQINSVFNPTFYFRYVDDIIIINYDSLRGINDLDINNNLSEIFTKNHLIINKEKTMITRFNSSDNLNFSYLGYQFKTINKKLLISISEIKLKKIIDNIKYSFYIYKKSNQSNREFWLLYYRLINIIYGVTSTNEKNRKIKFGIGYSYKFVNDEKQIQELLSMIRGLIHSCHLNSRKRSTLFYLIYTPNSSLEILNKRMDYTKLTSNQVSKIKNRLKLTTSSNNISRIFFNLYKNFKK